MPDEQLRLTSLRKSFGGFEAIKGVDLTVEKGEFCALLGPSGCGKSTLLRLIAGLEEPSSGRIEIAGRDVTMEEPSARQIAMVFQSYALYPHMTVAENIAFSLEAAGVAKPTRLARAAEVAKQLQLDALMTRRPAELSGGQRQRVAIGRALVRNPQVFLFDEPLSNLDALLRVQMRLELSTLHRELGATMVYVTHDQVEAMTMADKIVVMNGGEVQQIGGPMDLYETPANRFVAGFIGNPAINFLPGAALGLSAHEVGLRPEHIRLVPDHGAALAGTIRLVERLGNQTLVHVATPTGLVCVQGPGRLSATVGDSVGLACDADQALVFDANGRRH
ncbi:MAG: ABC transporter ATP-binding protein [Tabrizicola sp.]|uniref:ABC transporter ATP-binding protein n=1 Tax=Tabrizicola sp. TaxID=2005166 RepID=UPI002ABC43DC|nr:ABC transporter ATP-binding protein [Tabrizicola sp.]MDZ4085860.1 ABC transporter ATP-binding protein [Tabrizicola sp.]